MARRPKPAKTEPVVTSKCASGRPLLIDSALPTEFPVTPSKQRKRKFLTGARTHISIFNFSPFTTQNPAQLIQRHRSLTSPRRSNRRRTPFQIPKTVPPENSTASLFLSRCFTRASLRFHARPAPKVAPSAPLLPGSAQNVENDVTYSKQSIRKFLPGATTTSSPLRNNAALQNKNLSKNLQVSRRQPFLISGRPPLTLSAGWANMARTS
jgi:hypothetical protein